MMRARRGNIWLSMFALVIVIASSIVILGAGNETRSSYAQASSSIAMTDFSIPTGADPWGTASDSSGHLWVALPGCDPSPTCNSNTPPGKLAVYSPKTNSWIATYQLPVGFGQPLFLALDRRGRVWFPMPMSNSLGMLSPKTATFHQWAVPTAGAGPWDVAVDSNGIVWFTEHYSNKIGAFNPVTQTFKEIATPATDSLPYGITVDASNNVWFTENNSAVALIGEYTTQNSLLEYKIRTTASSGLTPHLITADPSGNVWWSEGWVGMIGELHIASALPGTNNGVAEYAYEYLCTTCGTHTSGISIDKKGNVWFDDSLQNTFGALPLSGLGVATMYNSPTPNSHPHDGLHVDTRNMLWFDEEFANKIARIIPPKGTGTPSPTPTPTHQSRVNNTKKG